MPTARSLTVSGGIRLGGGLPTPPLPWIQNPFPLHADPPDADPWMQTPTPVDRMTGACENITLPQTSFAGGNKLTLRDRP